MILQALAIVATLACGGALLALQLRSSGSNGASTPRTSPDPAAVSAEQWLLTNASHAHILVDQPTRETLVSLGLSVAQVLAYDDHGQLAPSGRTQPPELGFLALTSTIRSHPSSVIAQLISESAVVAEFGSGQQQVQIRQIVAEGMAASLPARRAARAFRTTAGAELLANHAVTESKSAAAALQAGQVDSSLLSVLATLALTHRFTISGFPEVAGESGVDEVRRTAEIVTIDGRPVRPGDTELGQVMGFFESQVGGFQPSRIHLTTGPTAALVVVFPLPALPA